MSVGMIPEGVPIRVNRIAADGLPLIIQGHVTTPTGVCPHCQQRSTHIHSHYWRSPQDLPWGAVPIRRHLACRKFWCDNLACPPTIFCERLPAGWLGVHQQPAQAVGACVTAWGWTASAAEVARVVTQQELPVRADTVMRALRAVPDPPVGPVRVLGVDEGARRKGHTYATILVDHEAHRLVDVLPDDAPETVAAWLQARPRGGGDAGSR
ncbi:MAG: transposase family protein [Clostridia bacterium]